MTLRAALFLFLFFSLSGWTRLHAEAALLLAEPFGAFGSMNPTGHAAIYLARVCATSPTSLRHCQPGEPVVVISRYHKVAGDRRYPIWIPSSCLLK